MKSLKKAPAHFVPIESIIEEFQISRATFWKYVDMGLIPKPKTYRAIPSDKIQKVRQGFLPPLAREMLQNVMEQKALGIPLFKIKTLGGFLELFEDAISTKMVWRLPYLPEMFRFDTEARMDEFYDHYEKWRGRKWSEDYEAYKNERENILDLEICQLVKDGDTELKNLGRNPNSHHLRSHERVWFEKNWQLFTEVVPVEVRDGLSSEDNTWAASVSIEQVKSKI